MLGSYNTLIGRVSVKETDDEITIIGLDAHDLSRDIERTWSSSKIAPAMFMSLRGKQVRIRKFFAVELKFILQTLLENKRNLTTRRSILAAIKELEENTWLKDTKIEHDSIVDLSRLSKFKWKPLDTQLEFIKHYDKVVPQYNLRGYMLGAKPGTGKAQPLSANIRVPGGWKSMGDMKIGSVVIAHDGTPSTVTGVYPQGIRCVYEIVFEDGRSTETCLEHLWEVEIDDKKAPRVVNTSFIRELLESGSQISIPLISPELSPDRELPFSVSDYAKEIKTNSSVKGFYILEEYLEAGINQRKELFSLLVQDEESFKTSNLILAYQLRRLAWSLGHKALLIKKDDGYLVRFELNTDGNTRLYFKSIKEKRFEPVQCISIDHPSRLYVTDDYIVTHNTFNALALMECLKMDTVIVVSPKNAIDSVWAKTIKEVYHKEQTYWVSSTGGALISGRRFYVVHYEHLLYLERFLQEHGSKLGKIGIVLDESHNLNLGTRQSLRTDIFIRCALNPYVEHVLWQSGTPIKAIGKEATPFLKTIDRYFTPEVEASFNAIFGREAKRAIDILSNRIGLTTYVVEKITKSELEVIERYVSLPNGSDYTLSTIAKKMREFIEAQLKYYSKNMSKYVKDYFDMIELAKVKSPATEKQWKDYLALTKMIRKSYDPKIHKTEPTIANKFEEQYILPYLSGSDKEAFRQARSVYKYYWLKVQGEALGRILGRARQKCITDIALNLDKTYLKEDKKDILSDLDIINNSNSKSVVFTSYVETADQYVKALEAKGMVPKAVHGGTNARLNEILKDFESKDEVNPLVATFQSLSTAVPLVMASTIIMLNQPFRDHERTQAIARCDRLGQKFNVSVYDIYLDTGNEPNISTRSKDILNWSKEQVEAIMARTKVNVSTESALYCASLEQLEELSGESFIEQSPVTEPLELMPEDALESSLESRSFLGW